MNSKWAEHPAGQRHSCHPACTQAQSPTPEIQVGFPTTCGVGLRILSPVQGFQKEALGAVVRDPRELGERRQVLLTGKAGLECASQTCMVICMTWGN